MRSVFRAIRFGLASVLAILLATAAALLATALPAHAATVNVTTADDSVNGADGVISLREAVDEANAAGEATTIVLVAATTYELDLCDDEDNEEEDLNDSGDLDHFTAQNLTIQGNGATIEQTCPGERILHTTDITTTVNLTSVTLTGGEGDGAAVNYAGDLNITGSTVSGNTSGANGTINSAAGGSGTNLLLTNSTVGPNNGRGIGGPNGAHVTVTGSTITQNTDAGVNLTDGSLTVSNSTVTNNGTYGVRTTGQGVGVFALTNTVVQGNGSAGVVCFNCGDLQVTGSQISQNDDGGISVNVDQDQATDDVAITVTTSSVFDNSRTGPGGGLRVEITQLENEAPPAQIVVTQSTFSGNDVTGASGRGGAIFAATGEVRVNNSTLVDNTATVSGGAVMTLTGDVFLQHATVVSNTAPVGSNIATGEDLHSFGSIVSAGIGAGDECGIAGTTTSSGYNVGGDGSCAFTGTGDNNTAGNPGLGALQNNGGPTLTRLPQLGSPALSAVPVANCTVFTVDQRGTARPQGAACEAGATEVNLAGGGGLAPTGVNVTGLVIAGVGFAAFGLVLLWVMRRAAGRAGKHDPQA